MCVPVSDSGFYGPDCGLKSVLTGLEEILRRQQRELPKPSSTDTHTHTHLFFFLTQTIRAVSMATPGRLDKPKSY